MRQYILLLFLLCSATIYSQSNSSINGKLIDNEYKGEPLAFGNISIKGTVSETNSNIDGFYSFENLKPGEYVLVYSFVGYETKEVIVNVTTTEKSKEVNVLMETRTPSFNKAVTSSTIVEPESETSSL